MVATSRTRRWPAYALAVLFLGYAVGKAGYASQARLGFPGGPAVSAAEQESYFLPADTAQWMATATGVVAAIVALATVTRWGRRVPRTVMLIVLAGMMLTVGAGAAIMVVDGFIGIGIGWQWHHGAVGVVVIGLLLAMAHSYVSATGGRRAPR